MLELAALTMMERFLRDVLASTLLMLRLLLAVAD
jgi:hypothetical protein